MENNHKYITNIVLEQGLDGINFLAREEFVAHFENFNGEIYEKDGITKIEQDSDIIKTGMILRNSNGDYHIIVMGDVNGDGMVASNDVLLMRRNIVSLTSLENIYVKAGDIDNNGLNSADALRLRRYIVGIGNT